MAAEQNLGISITQPQKFQELPVVATWAIKVNLS